MTTAADHTARLWDVRSQRPAGVLTGSTIPVMGAWFSPDGRTLATVNSDRTAHLWDIDASGVARRTCTVIDTQRWSRLLPDLPAAGVCR
ncbi:WD40 repeat domain-containing protein [Streptomyces sp. NPDC056149]|uniref:WD40 repeat domain-containing protein n=1 Tax=Streptomyces sp. NPDC056149 TaxID=3345728 RepID=UPI0035D8AA1D